MGFFKKLVSGITDFITSPITSLIGAGVDVINTNSVNHESRNQMYNQMAWQEKMWDKQNEYNDPSAQMARLAKAGINPIMQSGVGNMPAQSVGSVSSPNVQKSNIGDIIASAMNVHNSAKRDLQQSKLLDSQTQAQVIDNQTKALRNIWEINEIIARTRKELIEAKKAGKETDLLEKDLEYYDEVKRVSLDNMRSITDLNKKEYQSFDEKLQILREGIAVAKQNAKTNEYNAKTNRINAGTNRYSAETGRLSFQLQEKYYDISKAMADIDIQAKKEGIELTKQETRLIKAQAEAQLKRNGYIDLEECLKVIDTAGNFVGNVAKAVK